MRLGRFIPPLVAVAYCGVSLFLYRLRTLTSDWSAPAHSDALVLALPAAVAWVCCALGFRASGQAFGASMLMAAGTVAIAFLAFLFLALNLFGS